MDNEMKLFVMVLIFVLLVGWQWWEDDHALD